MSHIDDPAAHHADTTRLEALSDGVFAIAITLLVIEIGVPHLNGEQGLGDALRQLWPSYFGFAVSFLTIGVLWLNHHQMFKDIARADHTVTVLNLLLLMCVSFIPFPTAVLADFLRDGDQRLGAVLIYGATFTAMAVPYTALWLWVIRHPRLIDEHVSRERIHSRTVRYLPGAIMYGATMPVAYISPWISVVLFAAIPAFYLLPLNDTTS